MFLLLIKSHNNIYSYILYENINTKYSSLHKNRVNRYNNSSYRGKKKSLIHKRAWKYRPIFWKLSLRHSMKTIQKRICENGLKDNVSCTIRFINRIPTKYHTDIRNTLATISNRVHRITGTYLLFTVYTVIHE